MIVETNITIDAKSDTNIDAVVDQINQLLMSVNGQSSQINVTNMDNPIHNNPINYR